MRSLLLTLTTALAITFVGCSKSPEDGMVDTLEEAGDLIDGVKTKEDAERIKGELGRLMEKLEDYGKQLKDKGAEYMTTEKGKEIMEKTMAFAGKMMRIAQNSEIMAVLEEEMKKYRNK